VLSELRLADNLVAPLHKSALRELHDVPFVHEGHRTPLLFNGETEGLAYVALAPRGAHRLYAHPNIGEDLLLADPEFPEELKEALRLRGTGGVFNARVDILRVLPEDYDIHLLRVL
jgi:diadenosine tetraphosphatase ApaH/serine/threonine PP2A family protein phosphatase